MVWFWKTTRFFLLLGFVVAALVVCLAFAIGWWGSSQVVSVERSSIENGQLEIYRQPYDFGLKIEKLEVSSAAGFSLSAVMLEPISDCELGARGRRLRKRIERRAEVPVPRRDEVRGTILMLHGLGERKEQMFAMAERFTAIGFRCLVVDLRAHGDSGGDVCTFGIEECEDLRRVVQTAQEKFGELGPIGLFGVSLGGGIGLELMASQEEFACGVFVSPFASLASSVWRRAEQKLGSWRFLVVPTADVVMGMRYGFRMMEAAPVASATRIESPVMLIYGRDDSVVPIEDSEKVFSALQSDMKLLRAVDGGDHHAVLIKGGDLLYAEIGEYFLKHMW